jgi:ABC-type phosphate transport system auxiliary subunit
LTVRGEIAEQWANERDSLIENVETFVAKKLEEEIEELRHDIERFRDLEAEYAEKIVEEKHAMAETLSEELDQLVDKMDAFFDLRLSEEFKELREDLEVVKQNEFGRKIFEAFATEFNGSYIDEDSIQSKLQAAVAKLDDAQSTIAQLEESQSKMVRESKLEKILAPLQGKKREQMSFVLQNVETSRLEEAYNHFIGRVLKEEQAPAVRQEADAKSQSKLTESVVVTGEDPAPAKTVASDKFSQLRKLAGMNA